MRKLRYACYFLKSGDALSSVALSSCFQFNVGEDYPSAVCDLCISQINEFHLFRRNVVRNHNIVKRFRKQYGDEIVIPKQEIKEEPEDEEEGFLVDIIDEDNLIKIKEEYDSCAADSISDGISERTHETVKEVDVYHMDGELKTLVVKQESTLPVHLIPAPRKSVENGGLKTSQNKPPSVNILSKKPTMMNISKNSSVLNTEHQRPPVNLLKRPAATVLNKEVQEKQPKSAPIVCLKCRAVFRSRENLIMHERNDHGITRPQTQPPVVLPEPKINPRNTLFKCTKCNSSFIQEANYEHHLTTCKVALLARLNPQITIKRTKVPENQPSPSPNVNVINIARKNNDEPAEERRLRCPHCLLSYKTKHFLQKHLQDVHKIVIKDEVYRCKICNLTYSCSEDLQLHNQALHRLHVHSNVGTRVVVGKRTLINK